MWELKNQYFIAGCIYLGQVLVGYSMGWSTAVIPKLLDREESPITGDVTMRQVSLVVSLLYVGIITGPYVTGYVSNVKGRKPCLFLGGIITLTSYVTLALAKSVVALYVGRILTGVGVGIIFVFSLVYIGEIASTKIRGVLLTMTGIFGTLGTLIIGSVGPYLPYSMTGWLGAAMCAVYIGGIFTIPETPVFQVLQGHEKEARETLISLGREEEVDSVLSPKPYTPTSPIQDWLQLFTIYTNRKALFLTLTLSILQHMSGMMVVMIFFEKTIFNLGGYSVEHYISTFIGVTQIVASSITPFFVDRTGRKSLLLFSTALACLSHVVLGVFFHLDIQYDHVVSKIRWLPLVPLFLFLLSFNLGFGIIPGTLVGEMFTPNVRSSGTIIATTVSWLFGFFMSHTFIYMLYELRADVTFWIYSGVCALAFLFSKFFVPETKGKSLPEIIDMLSEYKN